MRVMQNPGLYGKGPPGVLSLRKLNTEIQKGGREGTDQAVGLREVGRKGKVVTSQVHTCEP